MKDGWFLSSLVMWSFASLCISNNSGAVGENDVEEMRRHAPFALQRLSDNELCEFGSREHEIRVTLEERRRQVINQQRGQLQEDGNGSVNDDECIADDDDHLIGSAQKYHPTN